MGVVKGGTENLTAGDVLEGRGNAAAYLHPGGVYRLAGAEPRQRGAESANQEDRLDQIAARLLDRERCKLAVVERAFGHDAVDTERQLLGDLAERDLGNVAIAAPLMRRAGDGRSRWRVRLP